jgi:hypothetical protein
MGRLDDAAGKIWICLAKNVNGRIRRQKSLYFLRFGGYHG